MSHIQPTIEEATSRLSAEQMQFRSRPDYKGWPTEWTDYRGAGVVDENHVHHPAIGERGWEWRVKP